MNLSAIINHLRNKTGFELSTGYENNIRVWMDWYKGYYKPFHHYTDFNGKETIGLERYSLKMAKKVCEDWASLLLNEKTSIVINNEAANRVIQGTNMMGGVFGDNNFWYNANELLEKTFALGTGAFVLRLVNGKIRIAYITADCIIPISFEQGVITEVAFASELRHKGQPYIYLETHMLGENGNYVITNEYFDRNFQKVTLFDDVIPEYDTGKPYPWFSVMKPNITNNIDLNSPLGVSVFSGAVDALKGVDLAFDNLCTDFYLGGKMVMMNEALIGQEKDGRKVAPQTSKKRLFQTIGDSVIDGKMCQEYNPALRVNENTEGVQAQLNYLSSKCGLGERYYSFNQGSVATATQVVSENSSLFRNIKRHEINVEQALTRLIKSILSIEGFDPESTEVTVMFDDSIIEDKAAERMQDRQDVSMGAMKLWEYRVKWYGGTDEEAKAIVGDGTDKGDGFPPEE